MRKPLDLVADRPQGFIFYRGPSLYDGSPIAAILTGLNYRSENGKTGGMLQTYILADNGKKVHENVFAGTDTGVCGDCPHRYKDGAGSCYVNPVTGAGQVALGLIGDKYPTLNGADAAKLVAGRAVRLGAYGDPAMVPAMYWLPLLDAAGGRTGYTHQWRKPWAQWIKEFVMASVESDREASHARRLGWRTFRVMHPDHADLRPDEIRCPASAEAGKTKTCEECMACGGGDAKKRSVAIVAHGPSWKMSRVKDLLQAKRQRKSLPVWN